MKKMKKNYLLLGLLALMLNSVSINADATDEGLSIDGLDQGKKGLSYSTIYFTGNDELNLNSQILNRLIYINDEKGYYLFASLGLNTKMKDNKFLSITDGLTSIAQDNEFSMFDIGAGKTFRPFDIKSIGVYLDAALISYVAINDDLTLTGLYVGSGIKYTKNVSDKITVSATAGARYESITNAAVDGTAYELTDGFKSLAYQTGAEIEYRF